MTKLDLKTFSKGFYSLVSCFEFSYDEIYLQLIFNSLKEKISQEIFVKGVNHILENTSKEDWNKAYGFKGRPALKDWIDAFVPKMQVVGKKVCEITGQLVSKWEYPADYQEFLNQQKGGKFDQGTIENKKNIQG